VKIVNHISNDIYKKEVKQKNFKENVRFGAKLGISIIPEPTPNCSLSKKKTRFLTKKSVRFISSQDISEEKEPDLVNKPKSYSMCIDNVKILTNINNE